MKSKIEFGMLFLATVTLVGSFLVPEVRQFFGLAETTNDSYMSNSLVDLPEKKDVGISKSPTFLEENLPNFLSQDSKSNIEDKDLKQEKFTRIDPSTLLLIGEVESVQPTHFIVLVNLEFAPITEKIFVQGENGSGIPARVIERRGRYISASVLQKNTIQAGAHVFVRKN